MQWGSIGWSVPASFGYAMGLEAGRRLVSVIGDGSFQLTAQEVSNMIRHGQEILIFLVNNRGYVIESAIHDGPYNYYKNWDYAGLIDVFNAEDGAGVGLTATTAGELADAIEEARAHKGGPVLIECQIPNDDASPELISWGSKVARRQFPPGPPFLRPRPRPRSQPAGSAIPEAHYRPLTTRLSFAVDMPDVCCPLG